MNPQVEPAGNARNIAIVLSYEGTGYHGWQKQPHLTTVQGILEETIAEITGETVTVIGAGRTDAGVHARGQVANFHTRCPVPTERIPVVLNTFLPEGIMVMKAVGVDSHFHSQYNAKSKTYIYRIDNGRWPDLFWRRYSLHRWGNLDLAAMSAAAAYFLGTHDFKSFCAAGASVKTFVRTIERCDIQRKADQIAITIAADGFLYNMVRIISGTILEVGVGRLDPGQIPAIISSTRRELAGPTLPPHGLCLEEVEYPENPFTGP